MLTQTTVTVSTTATLLTSTAAVTHSIAVANPTPNTIYIGDSTVTTSTGMEILATETYSVELRAGQSLYAIVASGTAAVIVLDVVEVGTAAAPTRIPIVLGGSPRANVATTVSGLGTAADGSLGIIRVGTYPDTEYVALIYDATNTRWVSENTYPLVYNSDLAYMGTNTTAYTYLSTDVTGSSTAAGIGVAVKPVRHAAELFTAGLKLQANLTAIMKGNATPGTFTIQAKFFQNDTADIVTFSSDGSTAVGECGSAITSGSGNVNIAFVTTGWRDVVQNGTSSALTSAQVTKSSLWPRIYGKNSVGTLYGSVIDIDLQARWVA